MAQIVRTESSIIFKLGPLERLISVHFRKIEVPISQLQNVEVVEDIWTRVRGVRAAFTWRKDSFMIGTRRGLFGKDFNAIYGVGRGVSVDFKEAKWARFVISVSYPEEIAALLRG